MSGLGLQKGMTSLFYFFSDVALHRERLEECVVKHGGVPLVFCGLRRCENDLQNSRYVRPFSLVTTTYLQVSSSRILKTKVLIVSPQSCVSGYDCTLKNCVCQ